VHLLYARLWRTLCSLPPHRPGVGSEPGCEREEAGRGEGAGHRLLVFAQLKSVLDLVESEVLAPLGVSFLRIDGGVEAAERFRRWAGVTRAAPRLLGAECAELWKVLHGQIPRPEDVQG
jgi:hypothetical protein